MLASLLACVLFGAQAPSTDGAGATGTADAAAPDLAPLQAQVTRLVQARLGEPAPGLALTVIHDGEVVWFRGFGVADVEGREPITADTVFAIASVSKTVAAWGFLRLVAARKVGLDEPVLEHLEGWRPRRLRAEAEGITLRRLLCHTAGLGVPGVEGVPHGEPVPELLDVLHGRGRRFRRLDLVQAPGEGFRYSGGGTSLAQLLFEQKTGRGFAEALRTDVLEPLGMTRSGFGWSPALVAASATPYLPGGERTPRLDYPQTAPAGFVSSSRDLTRFAIACMPEHRSAAAERVLPRAQLEVLLARGPECGFTGAGVFLKTIEGLPTVGHTGGDYGWTAVLRLVPDRGHALVVLQNCFQAEELSREIEALWARWVQGRLR